MLIFVTNSSTNFDNTAFYSSFSLFSILFYCFPFISMVFHGFPLFPIVFPSFLSSAHTKMSRISIFKKHVYAVSFADPAVPLPSFVVFHCFPQLSIVFHYFPLFSLFSIVFSLSWISLLRKHVYAVSFASPAAHSPNHGQSIPRLRPVCGRWKIHKVPSIYQKRAKDFHPKRQVCSTFES